MHFLDLPFLFKDYQETDRVHRQMRSFFADQFREKGFELLAWAEVGNVYLFSKKPIRKLQDLSGLKVWSWAGDPVAKETFAAMGVHLTNVSSISLGFGNKTNPQAGGGSGHVFFDDIRLYRP